MMSHPKPQQPPHTLYMHLVGQQEVPLGKRAPPDVLPAEPHAVALAKEGTDGEGCIGWVCGFCLVGAGVK